MDLNGLHLCVYCSASERIAPKYRQIGKDVGKLIASEGGMLVYGGGRLGIMGDVSNAVIAHGGHAIGYIPGHLSEHEGAHDGISELNIVDNMHTRKMNMYERSDAILVLPGGFGTLDEFFEVFTWKQLGLHHKPLIIFNYEGYWDNLITLMHQMIDENFARPEHREIFDVVTELDQLKHVLQAHRRNHNLEAIE